MYIILTKKFQTSGYPAKAFLEPATKCRYFGI